MKKEFISLFKIIKSFIAWMALTLLVSFSCLAQTTTKEERNKAAFHRYQELVNNHDAKGAAEYISKDMKNFGRVVGPEGIQRVLNDIFTTFPDWRAETLDIIAIGDTLIVRQKVTATHLGTGKIFVNGGLLVGVPPTGKKIEISHMHWYTMSHGKILAHYGNRDDLGMMQQLGLVPLSLAKPADSTTVGKLK